MTDRVYPSKPSTKPNGTTPTNGGATTTAAITANRLPLPPTKAHLHNPTRHPDRPNPATRRRRNRRSCFCCCCFSSIVFITAVLLLSAIAGAAVYLLYRPHRPTFSYTTLKISQFNLTTSADDDSTRLTTKLNLTISSTNPNKKITFHYDYITITTLSSNGVQFANGTFTNFTSAPQNVTYMHSTLLSSSQVVDSDSVTALRSDLKKKNNLPIKIVMETQVVVKVEKLKSKKVGLRIKCEGIRATIPKGKSISVATTTKAKCSVDLRIKIWKWTF